MPFAFVVHPKHQPARAGMFLHTEFSLISEFEPKDLESIARRLFTDEYDLEDFEFFELGIHMPITFERQVSWTMNQD